MYLEAALCLTKKALQNRLTDNSRVIFYRRYEIQQSSQTPMDS